MSYGKSSSEPVCVSMQGHLLHCLSSIIVVSLDIYDQINPVPNVAISLSIGIDRNSINIHCLY